MSEILKEIASCFSEYMYNIFFKIPSNLQDRICEIRLRSSCPIVLNLLERSTFLCENGNLISNYKCAKTPLAIVKKNDIEISFRKMCNYSVFSYQEEIKNGYISLRGGHRVGICGTAVYNKGAVSNVREISAINIRINHKISDIDRSILSVIDKDFRGLIIAGTPGSGKTTILRNIARILSYKTNVSGKLQKVIIVDERNEFSGSTHGISQNDLGLSDILVGFNKKDAIQMAIRVLSPDIIICDELGHSEDIEAITSGINCGVKFVFSLHAGTTDELFQKSIVKDLIAMRVVSKIVLLDKIIAGKPVRTINLV